MKKIAVYAGSFDPITNGHMDLIQRASKLFEHVIVAIGVNAHKTPMLSAADRMGLVEACTTGLSNVSVKSFDGLLVNFVREHQANIILRGLRVVTDFDFEFQLYGANHKLAPEIETIFLPASEGNSFISSSIVRDIHKRNGDITPFVPEIVIKFLANQKKG